MKQIKKPFTNSIYQSMYTDCANNPYFTHFGCLRLYF